MNGPTLWLSTSSESTMVCMRCRVPGRSVARASASSARLSVPCNHGYPTLYSAGTLRRWSRVPLELSLS